MPSEAREIETLDLEGAAYVSKVTPMGGVGIEAVAVLQRSLDEALAPFLRLRTQLLLVLALGLALSLAGGVLLASRVTRPVAVLVLIGSLLALLYVWKLVEAAYFEPVPEGAPVVREAPWSMLLPIWLLVGANLYFGVHTEVTVGLATQAANELIGFKP